MRFSLIIAATLLATTLVAPSAKADPSPSTDWARVVSDLDTLARKGADVLDSPRCSPAGCLTDTNATAAQPERVAASHVQVARSGWVSFAPTLSLVARDWSSAYRVAGERLALVEGLRLTSSTRMVLGRVRLNDSRISPYAQVGLGQWRTDPYLLPLSQRYTEIAAQTAGGIELRLMGTWQMALESTMTVLYRESSSRSDPAPHMWSTTIVSRVEF
jgi:hypothetical protein